MSDTKTVTVVILDQFSSPSPYWLQQQIEAGDPYTWQDLLRDYESGLFNVSFGVRPRLTEVPEDYRPEMCETVFREDANGNAEVWKYRWDSSG